jgi:hypothetical protein
MAEKQSETVACPNCGTEWQLDSEESQKPEFTCGDCNRPVDVQRARVLDATEKTVFRFGAKFWRWIFLCSITSNLTLVILSFIEARRGYYYLDANTYPIRACIVDFTLLSTGFFLLIFSPAFLRGIGFLGVLGLITVLINLVLAMLPTF